MWLPLGGDDLPKAAPYRASGKRAQEGGSAMENSRDRGLRNRRRMFALLVTCSVLAPIALGTTAQANARAPEVRSGLGHLRSAPRPGGTPMESELGYSTYLGGSDYDSWPATARDRFGEKPLYYGWSGRIDQCGPRGPHHGGGVHRLARLPCHPGCLPRDVRRRRWQPLRLSLRLVCRQAEPGRIEARLFDVPGRNRGRRVPIRRS